MIGAMIGSNRQAQFYCALCKDNEEAVLVEEYFPYTVAGRKNNTPPVVNVPKDSNYDTAREMFRTSTIDREVVLIDTIDANNTAYRVYQLSPLKTLEEQYERLVNDPLVFRSSAGKLALTINGLAVPPIPEKRPYRRNPRKGKNRKIMTVLLSLLAAAAILACVAFVVLPGVTGQPIGDLLAGKPPATATPQPTEIPTPTPMPTPSPTPVPTNTPVPVIASITDVGFEGEVLNGDGYLLNGKTYILTGKAQPGADMEINLTGETWRDQVAEDGSFYVELPAEKMKPGVNRVTVTCESAYTRGIAVSDPVDFLYKPNMQQMVLDQPIGQAEGAEVISGKVEAEALVTLYVNDRGPVETVCDENGQFSFAVEKLCAADQVKLTAKDMAGNSTGTEGTIPYQPVVLNLDGDLKTNEKGFVQTLEQYTVEGEASDRKSVVLYLNGAACQRTQVSAGAFFFTVEAKDLTENEENLLCVCYEDAETISSDIYSFFYKPNKLRLKVDNEVLREGVRTITGKAEVGCTVTLKGTGVEQSCVASGEGTFTFANISLKEGQKITVSAHDSAGNADEVTLEVLNRGSLKITNYADANLGGKTIVVYGQAEGGEVLACKVRLEGKETSLLQPELQVEGKDWRAEIDSADLEHGKQYVFEIYYIDEPEIESRTMYFKADIQCEMTANDPIYKNDTAELTGTTKEAKQIELLDAEGHVLDTVQADADGTYALTVALLDEDRPVILRAKDALGNEWRSAYVLPEKPRQAITVAELPDLLGLADLPVKIHGTASAGKKVQLNLKETVLDAMVADDGTWACELAEDLFDKTDDYKLEIRYAPAKGKDYSDKTVTKTLKVDLQCAAITGLPEKVEEMMHTLHAQTEALAVVKAKTQNMEMPLTVTADQDGKFELKDWHTVAGEEWMFQAEDAAGNMSETVTVRVTKQRQLCVGKIVSPADDAQYAYSAEQENFTFKCSAWLVGKKGLKPIVVVQDTKGKEIRKIEMKEMTAEELDQLVQQQKLNNEEVVLEAGWKAEEEITVSEPGEYTLRLMIKDADNGQEKCEYMTSVTLKKPEEASPEAAVNEPDTGKKDPKKGSDEPKKTQVQEDTRPVIVFKINEEKKSVKLTRVHEDAPKESVNRKQVPYLAAAPKLENWTGDDYAYLMYKGHLYKVRKEDGKFFVNVKEGTVSLEEKEIAAKEFQVVSAEYGEDDTLQKITILGNKDNYTILPENCERWEELK